MKRLTHALSLLLCITLLTACQTGSTVERIDTSIVEQLTIDNLGACQGVFVWQGSVWLYGDRDDQGVIKRLEWVGPNDQGEPMLRDAGETYELKLYRNRHSRTNPDETLPRNLIPHPSGLTHHPDYDAFIANTHDQEGTIYAIHFLGLTESGSLDDWIMNKVEDDLATNGSRPEFIRYNGRWLIATADNGDQGNQLRLYDPDKLKKAKKTSEEGVLVAAFDCGPLVQSLHWIEGDQTLILVHNKAFGLDSRLTLMKFADGPETPTVERVIYFTSMFGDFNSFAVVAPGWAVMSSASKENNLTVIRWPIEARD